MNVVVSAPPSTRPMHGLGYPAAAWIGIHEQPCCILLPNH